MTLSPSPLPSEPAVGSPSAVQPPAPAASPQGPPAYRGADSRQVCRFCGCVPAVQATVRRHVGMLVLMRFVRLDGPFCRRCGIATVRDMTAKSLVQGWWGYASSVINPITMLLNVGPMLKFKRLPEPEAGYREPLHLGKPLFRRPEILGLLVPVAVVALIVAAVVSSTDHRAVAGACIVNRGTDDAPQIAVVDCGGDEAAYRIVGRVDGVADDSQCDQFRDAVATYTQEADSATYTLCLAPVGNAS